jgi:hypothetical protein
LTLTNDNQTQPFFAAATRRVRTFFIYVSAGKTDGLDSKKPFRSRHALQPVGEKRIQRKYNIFVSPSKAILFAISQFRIKHTHSRRSGSEGEREKLFAQKLKESRVGVRAALNNSKGAVERMQRHQVKANNRCKGACKKCASGSGTRALRSAVSGSGRHFCTPRAPHAKGERAAHCAHSVSLFGDAREARRVQNIWSSPSNQRQRLKRSRLGH